MKTTGSLEGLIFTARANQTPFIHFCCVCVSDSVQAPVICRHTFIQTADSLTWRLQANSESSEVGQDEELRWFLQ